MKYERLTMERPQNKHKIKLIKFIKTLKTIPSKRVKAELSVGETILMKLAIDNVLPDGPEVIVHRGDGQ